MSNAADPLDPALRELGKVLHERYQLAARIARATWPAADTSPEAMVAAAATLFIELSRQLPPAVHHPAAGSPPAGAPRACPVCGGVMRDQRGSKTNSRQPDFKCSQRACDGAVWLDRKQRNGTHA